MCTVSWIHTPRGYELFCNRDEAISRESAFAPGAIDRNGVRVLAPLDGRHGGTWIAVNEFGLALCLTNGVRGGFGARAPGDRSRGLLVLDWSDSRDTRDLLLRAARADLSPFAPFTLAAIEPGRNAVAVEWDGAHAALHDNAGAFLPLCSSSVDPAGARDTRRALFGKVKPTSPRALEGFQRSCRVNRADARTVSFTRLRVSARAIELSYQPLQAGSAR